MQNGIKPLLLKLRSLSNSRDGFTLIELLVFSAIFAVVAVTFVAILISVTQVQVRESSNAEVNRQSQFIIHTIQRNIEESSLIEMDPGPATSTLVLRAIPSTDTVANRARTYIYAKDGFAYIKINDNGTPEALNTDRVKVDSLTFNKRSNAPGHDSVDITLAISYNSTNAQRKFSQLIQTSIARVNAASFDSNLVPASNNALNIGAADQYWSSLNGVIWFGSSLIPNEISVGVGPSQSVIGEYKLSVYAPGRGGLLVQGSSSFDNVGIGTIAATGTYAADINGPIKIHAKNVPTCSVSSEVGGIYLSSAAGVSYLRLCTFDSISGTYKWFYLTATTTPSY